MDERIKKMYRARIAMMKVEVADLVKEIERLENAFA